MKMLVRGMVAVWLLTLLGIVVFAQNPQSTLAPIVSVNSAYNNGVSPGYRPTAGSGLVLNVGPGTTNCSGTIETYAGATLSMTASAVNYVYLNTSASCVPAVKTSPFGASDIPVATVTAGGSAITANCNQNGTSSPAGTYPCIIDDRTIFTVPSSGGSGITQLTGDGTAGPGSGSQALTLATVNSGPGSCGDGTHVCQVTTNGKGLVTSQIAVSITASGGTNVKVNGGSALSTVNLNSSTPAPGGGLTAVTFDVDGSGNTIATVPSAGYPTSFNVVFTGDSKNGDDLHVLGQTITVTAVNCNGTTCAITNSGTNGLSAGDWVYTVGVTNPSFLSTASSPYSILSTKYGLFQVLSSGLTSTHFSFNYALASGTCASACGSIYGANYFSSFQSARQPFFKNSVAINVLDDTSGTIEGLATNYATLFHALSPAVTSVPGYMVINDGTNDIQNCTTLSTVEAGFQSLWSQAHTDGWVILQNTLTPAPWNVSSLGCPAAFVNQGTLNSWLLAQGKGITNAASGEYWDAVSPVGVTITDPSDANFIASNGGYEPGGAVLVAHLNNEALATQSSAVQSNYLCNQEYNGCANVRAAVNLQSTLDGLNILQNNNNIGIGVNTPIADEAISGQYNIAIGMTTYGNAANSTGDIAMGYQAEQGFGSQSGNTFNTTIGTLAAHARCDGNGSAVTVTDSTFVGAGACYNGFADTDETVLGNGAQGAGSHSTTVGSSSTTDVYDGYNGGTATVTKHHAAAYVTPQSAAPLNGVNPMGLLTVSGCTVNTAGVCVVGTAVGTVSLSSIPSAYTKAVVTVTGETTAGSPEPMRCTFNGDGGTNYDSTLTALSAVNQPAPSTENGQTNYYAGNMTGGASGKIGKSTFTFENYSSTTFDKSVTMEAHYWLTSQTQERIETNMGEWNNNTTALSSISCTLDSSSLFSVGTTFQIQLY